MFVFMKYVGVLERNNEFIKSKDIIYIYIYIYIYIVMNWLCILYIVFIIDTEA